MARLTFNDVLNFFKKITRTYKLSSKAIDSKQIEEKHPDRMISEKI